jgi:hypothetical protein
LELLDVKRQQAQTNSEDNSGERSRLVDEYRVKHDASEKVEHSKQEGRSLLVLHFVHGQQDDRQLLNQGNGEERGETVVKKVRADSNVQKVMRPTVIVRQQGFVVDATQQEVHDAISNEKNCRVTSNVCLVVNRRRESVVAHVVEQVQANERGDKGRVQSQVPRVVRELERSQKVVHKGARNHVTSEKQQIIRRKRHVFRHKLRHL